MDSHSQSSLKFSSEKNPLQEGKVNVQVHPCHQRCHGTFRLVIRLVDVMQDSQKPLELREWQLNVTGCPFTPKMTLDS